MANYDGKKIPFLQPEENFQIIAANNLNLTEVNTMNMEMNKKGKIYIFCLEEIQEDQ
jgi:hypothetical protein